MTEDSSILFCATPRSGSTFICETFAERFAVNPPREWFQRTKIEEMMRLYGMAPETGLVAMVKMIVEREKDSRGLFSLKIMWDTLEPLLLRMRKDLPPTESKTDFQLLREIFPKPVFVLITRRNRLRQAISYTKALQSGIWENRGKGFERGKPALPFDFLKIEAALAVLQRHRKGWEDFFLAAGMEPFEVAYEDFMEDREGVLEALGRHLELPSREKRGISPSPLRSMWDSVNEEWEKAYRRMDRAVARGEHSLESLRMVPEAYKARLSTSLKSLEGKAGEPISIPVRVTNASAWQWNCVGSRDGKFWIRIDSAWIDGKDDAGGRVAGTACLPERLDPDESVERELSIRFPDRRGRHLLRVDLVHEGITAFEEKGNKALEIPVVVKSDPSREKAGIYFGTPKALEAGWKWLPWLGYYFDAYFPWIKHWEHDWLFCDDVGYASSSFFFWSSRIGWFWTNEKEYPKLWRARDGCWLRYEEGSRNPRRFLNLESDRWEICE